jgi:hypothetical protein
MLKWKLDSVCVGDSANLDVILEAPDSTPRMRLKWMLILVHLEILLILSQVRCMVCAERTIG